VWQRPSLHDAERFKGSMERSAPRTHNPSVASASHLNQKPLEFMERQVSAVTNVGDVVWEPFGGLASASVAAVSLGRRAYVAEIHKSFQDLAEQRLEAAAASATESEQAS
jgi:DNA modification methylase